MKLAKIKTLGLLAVLLGPTSALADTIDPATFAATVGVGESVTVRKTVTINDSGPTDALLDVHFLFDTSGSMGSAIGAAKTAADQILANLDAFGDLAASVGVFSEGATLTDPDIRGRVISLDLNTDTSAGGTVETAIDSNVILSNPDGGGDFPERGQDAVVLAADNLSWRTGSNRFIIAFGDASWKNDITSDAAAIASLAANNVTLIGIRSSNFSGSDIDSDDLTFTQSVTDLGGTVYNSGTSAAAITADITAGISAGFATYSNVTVDDLGNGSPLFDVSTTCISADVGACSGSDAVGSFDRSVERSFVFDVTFTRVVDGDITFDTYALVDGGIVATEVDRFTSGPAADVPAPATLGLMALSLIGIGVGSRRRK